jgi:hypothetical protein
MKSVTCTATSVGGDYPGAGATVGPGAVFAFLAGPNTRVKALLPRTRARLDSGPSSDPLGAVQVIRTVCVGESARAPERRPLARASGTCARLLSSRRATAPSIQRFKYWHRFESRVVSGREKFWRFLPCRGEEQAEAIAIRMNRCRPRDHRACG